MAIPLTQKIAILVNPLSGKGKAVKIGKWLSDQLKVKNISHSVFYGQWPESLEEFDEIWLVGGDGTMNYFLNQYKHNILPLVLYKGGTGNDIAWKLYGESTVQEQLDIALHALPRSVDAALCNDQVFVNSSGIGFDGEVLRSVKTIRWLGGHFGYLLIVICKVFTFKESRFIIRIANKKIVGKFLLVNVNNSSRTGGGFMVTPRASVNDGKLDMMLCRPLSIWKRLRYLPVIEKGKHLNLPFILYSQEEVVRIEAPGEIYAQLDGELVRARSFDLKILPGKLMIKY